jgi:hypothetical protein
MPFCRQNPRAMHRVVPMLAAKNTRTMKMMTQELAAVKFPLWPGWAQPETGGAGGEEVAFRTGAAVAQLHLRVMADPPFAGAWRRRLALKAAVASPSTDCVTP